MDLFLAIQIHDDPLFLPVKLEEKVQQDLSGITFFQLDNHASPALISTAMAAVERANRVFVLVESATGNSSSVNALFPVFRKVVECRKKVFWTTCGENKLQVFSAMIDRKMTVQTTEESVKLAKDFFAE